jgi:hypothetical protein
MDVVRKYYQKQGTAEQEKITEEVDAALEFLSEGENYVGKTGLNKAWTRYQIARRHGPEDFRHMCKNLHLREI